MSLKKTDLAAWIHEQIGGTKSQSLELVEGLFEIIAKTMAQGDSVDVAGFGKFVGATRPAGISRNPKTNETKPRPATRVPKFRASKPLKERVMDGK